MTPEEDWNYFAPSHDMHTAAAGVGALRMALLFGTGAIVLAMLIVPLAEQRSTQETADSLGLSEENVRVRLHRSRAALREQLHTTLGDCLPDAFAFEGSRCNRIVAKVLSTLTVQHGAPERT